MVATRMVKKALKIPHKIAKTFGMAAEMVEVGCTTIMVIDQATSGVHKALSEASDSHSRNVEEVAVLSIWKGKAPMRYHPKVMKVRQPAASILKTHNGETYHSMLEKFVPPWFKEELLQEEVSKST